MHLHNRERCVPALFELLERVLRVIAHNDVVRSESEAAADDRADFGFDAAEQVGCALA